jgi:hypothetical protein
MDILKLQAHEPLHVPLEAKQAHPQEKRQSTTMKMELDPINFVAMIIIQFNNSLYFAVQSFFAREKKLTRHHEDTASDF